MGGLLKIRKVSIFSFFFVFFFQFYYFLFTYNIIISLGTVSSFGTAISVDGLLKIRKVSISFFSFSFFNFIIVFTYLILIFLGTISSFRMVIGYRGKWEAGVCRSAGIFIVIKKCSNVSFLFVGLSKPTRVNSNRVEYQFRLRFDLTHNSTHDSNRLLHNGNSQIELDSTRLDLRVDPG